MAVQWEAKSVCRNLEKIGPEGDLYRNNIGCHLQSQHKVATYVRANQRLNVAAVFHG